MCECHAFHKSTTAVAYCLGLQLLFDIISPKLIQIVSTSTMLTYTVTNCLAISIIISNISYCYRKITYVSDDFLHDYKVLKGTRHFLILTANFTIPLLEGGPPPGTVVKWNRREGPPPGVVRRLTVSWRFFLG